LPEECNDPRAYHMSTPIAVWQLCATRSQQPGLAKRKACMTPAWVPWDARDRGLVVPVNPMCDSGVTGVL